MKRLQKLKYNNENLFKRYGLNHTFQEEIRMIHALAFLDPGEISDAFQIVYNNISNEAKTYGDQFFRIYVANTARFPKTFWSISGMLNSGMPRTQAWAESFHHQMNAVLDKKHVGIYTFVKFMKDRFIVVESDIEASIEGQPQKKRSSKHFEAEKRVLEILKKKTEIPTLHLLRAIANNM